MANFRLGHNAMNQLGEIAQEHLIYKYDIEKALNVFKTGLNMPDEYALECIWGKNYVLKLEDDGETAYLTERSENDEYPILDVNYTITQWFHNIFESSCQFYDLLISIKNKNTYSITIEFDNLNEFINENIYVSHEEADLYNIIANSCANYISNLEEYEDNENVETINIIRTIRYINVWKETVYKKLKIMQFMINNGWTSSDEIAEYIKEHKLILGFKNTIEKYNEVCNLFNEIVYKSTNVVCENPDEILVSISTFANKADEIRPCDVSEKHDAYWLSPTGELYGADGSINNMLHLCIADKLIEDEIITPPNAQLVDSYLEEHGWCKIHNDWIMFDPYANSKDFKTISNHLTDEQVNVICEYLKLHYNSFGQFGISHYNISSVTFKCMDKIMRNKLFAY